MSAVEKLKQFVEGTIDTAAFERLVYSDPDIETLLVHEPAPAYATTGITLYHYLLALNYRCAVDMLNAQTALSDYLAAQGVAAEASTDKAALVALIVAVEPKWLQLAPAVVQELMAEAPADLAQPALKAWLKQQIRERFRYAKTPPRWLQAPAWPIGDAGPLVFLRQVAIPDYFHDEAVAYVFYDPATRQCQTILQTA